MWVAAAIGWLVIKIMISLGVIAVRKVEIEKEELVL
jgi:hypothetical protein